MIKKFKLSMDLLLMAGLLATYVACSESTIEDSTAGSSKTSVGFSPKVAVCTCASCTNENDNIFMSDIYRDPDCSTFSCGSGTYPAHQLLGFTFSGSNSVTKTEVSCGTALNTGDGTYHMYFYNEKGYDADTTNAKGRPMLFLDNSTVQAYYVGNGNSVFSEYACIDPSCVNWESDPAYDLPYSANYRIGSVCTGYMFKSTIAGISDNCIIGNNFQQVTTPTSPDEQQVYLLKLYDNEEGEYYYYVFMVYYFQNSSSQPLKKYMTIKYRQLVTC